MSGLIKLCGVLPDQFNPDGVEPREEELRALAGARLIDRRNGMLRPVTDFDPEGAGYLHAALDARMAPRRQVGFLDGRPGNRPGARRHPHRVPAPLRRGSRHREGQPQSRRRRPLRRLGDRATTTGGNSCKGRTTMAGPTTLGRRQPATTADPAPAKVRSLRRAPRARLEAPRCCSARCSAPPFQRSPRRAWRRSSARGMGPTDATHVVIVGAWWTGKFTEAAMKHFPFASACRERARSVCAASVMRTVG